MKGKFLFLILILTSNLNFSQVLYWQELHEFRYVYDLEVVNDQAIFVSQQGDMTQARGLIRSTDFGNTWAMLTNLPDGFRPYELSYDSSDSVLYCFSMYSREVVKSFDRGDSWIVKNTGPRRVRHSTISNSGTVFCCAEDSNFAYSLNQGDNWFSFKLPGARISDLDVNSSGALFASTYNLGLQKTSDFGVTWEKLFDGYVRSLDIDEMDHIYITTLSHVLISKDGGTNWLNTNYSELSPDLIEVDSDGKIYVSDWHGGLFREENGTWSNVGLGWIENLMLTDSSKILAISKGNNGGDILFLYDPSAIPYVGTNYLPLNLGNKWEQFYSYSNGMDPIYDYGLNISSVYKDTTIENQKYYKVNGLSSNWLRYADSSNILFAHYSSNDFVFIDFNKLPGETYYSYRTSTDSSLYEVISSTENLFGQSVNCKGFKVSEWPSVRTYLFAENFGFYKSTYSSSDIGSSSSTKIIQAILINVVNDTTYYPHNYYPEFFIDPIIAVNNEEFNLTFQVDHQYTKFYHHVFFPDDGINYIGNVSMEFFYHKKNYFTELDTVFASNTPLTRNYTIQMNLDSTFLNSGYELKYRLTATEIGILPKSTTVPDTGWYTCIYDNTVSVEDETNNLPHQFSLAQNYPNPFNPTTTIKYVIAEDSFVNISVFDVLGRKVAVLVNENKSPGEYHVEFNAENYNSGIYFYQIDSGNFKEVKKMLLLK